MAVATVDEYLSALEKSKLLASEQLAQAQTLAGDSSDAPALARALARENLVSRWQAGTLLALGQRAQLRLGKYKLIERLGKGGMGTVFLAEHVTMNRRVALKIVPRSIAEDQASLDRFFSEARSIAALDHPNIVQAYSVDNEMDRYFIVMEYVDGQDLQQMVESSGPLEFNRAADFIRQAAEGLAHAHARNLVHCDIKPSNLLVNNQGVIKILDLGLARLNQSDEARGGSAGASAFGTVDYMSPEQGLGTTDFDHRADIYSLGCTLYYLLTGHPPFPEGSLAQRIVKHQTIEPRDILAERPGTPPKLVEICKQMMAKQPEDRYQSIQEVSAALAPLLGIAATPSAPPPRAVKPIEDVVPNGNGGGNDWLAGLTRPPSAPIRTNGATQVTARPVATGAVAKSDAQAKKSQAPKGIAALFAWFNSAKRKVIGAIVAVVALAAISALAALPLMLSQPKSPPTPQAKAADKPTDGNNNAAPGKSSADKQPAIGNKPEQNPTPKVETAKPIQPEAKPPEKPKTEVKPETKPPIVPPVKPPAVPEVKPTVAIEKPKPPSKPVEVVKQVTLDGLTAAVDLPPMGKDSTDGVSLGKLELAPKMDLDIQLLGGETVAKGNAKFEAIKEGGDVPGWSLMFAEKGKDSVKAARVYLEGGECKIQWTADAKDKASLLRFCGLQFASGTKKHFTALTAPKTVPPLVIDMDTPVVRPKHLSRDFALCDPSLLRLQILPLDKAMPKHEIKVLEKTHAGRATHNQAPETIAGDTIGVKGHAYVMLTKEHAPPIALTIGFDARGKDVLVEMQGVCEIANTRLPLNAGALQGFNAKVEAFLMMNDNNKGRKPAASAEQVQLFKKAKEELKSLSDLAGELNQKASIPFRVYTVAGQPDDNAAPKIILFESGQAEAPKTPAQKKKGSRQKGRNVPDADEVNLK